MCKKKHVRLATFPLLITALFVVLTAAIPGKVSKINFTGKWTLNVDKSEFGNTPQRAAVKQFLISQKEDSIYIERVTVNANNEEEKSNEVLSLDGKECVKVLASGRTKKSSVTWSSDGKIMTTISSYSVPNEPEKTDYTLTQAWELDNSNKELVVNLQSPAYTIKVIYDKQ